MEQEWRAYQDTVANMMKVDDGICFGRYGFWSSLKLVIPAEQPSFRTH
jgi:hypothetical protein